MILRIILNKMLEKAGITTLIGSLFFTSWSAYLHEYTIQQFYYFMSLNLLVAYGLLIVIFTGQEFLKYKKIKDGIQYTNKR